MPFTRNTTIYPAIGTNITKLEQTKRSMFIEGKITAFKKRIEQIQERNRAQMMLFEQAAKLGGWLEGKEQSWATTKLGAEKLGVQIPKGDALTKDTLLLGEDRKLYSVNDMTNIGRQYNAGDEAGRKAAELIRKSAKVMPELPTVEHQMDSSIGPMSRASGVRRSYKDIAYWAK